MFMIFLQLMMDMDSIDHKTKQSSWYMYFIKKDNCFSEALKKTSHTTSEDCQHPCHLANYLEKVSIKVAPKTKLD